MMMGSRKKKKKKYRNKRWLDDVFSMIKEALKDLVDEDIKTDSVLEVMTKAPWWAFCPGDVAYFSSHCCNLKR